ncbi:hypothetical protein Calhy_0773 [Caldicellulosiruptor hydrothermalis 108]|uniref:Uncharacterized protein n=1 Tax=Caldicellulosiruptor hydrothermalis (strain DSM 18901 / VKM B-2411 / 108) TaxID=632292 RepID=E4QE16_CALH1|nr:hypothetical protein [Caldicellulosiruptor hydrothermalis]ADQ06510.1 hypothetical protein Calhy_0773 [Caldicellulosiruptor hydrothermalis 108]
MAKEGRIVLRDCVPDGSIDVARVKTGEIITRSWTFRVNQVPDLQSVLDAGTFDPRNILRGHQGELYDGDGNFLAEVNEWTLQFNFKNQEYQAAGSKWEWAIPVAQSATLTFVETVIRDATLLQKVMNGLKKGQPDAVLNFMGVLKPNNM